MARPRRKQDDAHTDAMRAFDWWGSSDSTPGGAAEWDIKREALADVVLGLLGSGRAIMFGVTRDGGAVSITIYDGDAKSRKYVADSIEFDDAMDTIWHKLRPRPVTDISQERRATGD